MHTWQTNGGLLAAAAAAAADAAALDDAADAALEVDEEPDRDDDDRVRLEDGACIVGDPSSSCRGRKLSMCAAEAPPS